MAAPRCYVLPAPVQTFISKRLSPAGSVARRRKLREGRSRQILGSPDPHRQSLSGARRRRILARH